MEGVETYWISWVI